MRRFRNILVIPSAPSADDVALTRAVKLAQNNAALLTVIWPIDDDGDAVDYMQEIIEAVGQQLEEAVVPARQLGLDVATKIRVGRPFVEVIRQILQGGHDLVMKTARGREIRPSLFFGSTALHLFRKSPCPVWIINPEPGERSGVLAAIDPDTTDDEAIQLNRTILELATSMSVIEETSLQVLHAWNVPQEDMIRHSPYLRLNRSEAIDHINKVEERHRVRFEMLVEEFRPRAPHMETHFIKGIAEDVIPSVAKEKGVEVVVMATLARSGIPGLLIGDTAEGVLGQIDCSVLALKPAGFVSPVTL